MFRDKQLTNLTVDERYKERLKPFDAADGESNLTLATSRILGSYIVLMVGEYWHFANLT